VFSVARLHLHATSEAVEYQLRRLLREGGIVEIGLGHATPRELVEAAHEQQPAGAMRLGVLGEQLIVDAVAEQASGVLGSIAQSRGLRRSLHRAFATLGGVGVGARDLQLAAHKLGGEAGAHGEEIARRFVAYHKHLAAAELYDEAMAWRAGCRAIADGVQVAMLDDVDVVETHAIHDWDASRLQLLDALLQRGLSVRVQLPALSDLPPQASRALDQVLAALEARHGSARLERVEVPLARAAELDFSRAASPSAEARAVARRVRDLVDSGVAPETIAVCAATPERRARLGEQLLRYGVPVAPRHPPRASEAPPVRAALELLALADDGIPRERLIAFLSSRYVAGEANGRNGLVLPHEIAAALREAGCTDAASDGYAPRLLAWGRSQNKNMLRIGRAETICTHVDLILERVQSLPAETTLARHCSQLKQSLVKFQLFERARGYRRDKPIDSAEETRAIARDQAAMRELEVALEDLPRAAQRAGLRAARLTRARFARLLADLLSTARARASAMRGAAVELGDFADVVGRRFTHLFACGLVDGEVPARPPEDPLLPDDDAMALNRALGVAVLPLASRAVDRAALAFHVALASTEAAHLSWPRADEDGAPLLRSPLLEELHPAETLIRELPRDPIVRARDARTVDELAARVVLESRGDAASRLASPDPDAGGALPLVLAAHDPPRFARLEHLVAMERARHRFFINDAPPHGFVGLVRDPELLLQLAQQKLPGRRDEPLSATSIEAYASCPFKFFLRSVLKVREAEEADDELDHLAFGRLHHLVLERLFRRFADEGRFPLRATVVELELVDEVCDDVIAEWRKTEAVGHPALFAVKERQLREQVTALVRGEARVTPSPGCRPSQFEREFGPLPVRVPCGDDVWLKGQVDRVDLGDGRAVVLDYKIGAKKSYSAQVSDEAVCVTAWQLPIYAVAVRSELGISDVDARFYSLRDGAPTRPVREPPHFAVALGALHQAMRAGDFTVRPREDACQRCNMEAACRVRQLKLAEDEP
jgi:RecB family exonuclease